MNAPAVAVRTGDVVTDSDLESQASTCMATVNVALALCKMATEGAEGGAGHLRAGTNVVAPHV